LHILTLSQEKGSAASAGGAVAEEETGVSAQDKKKAYSDKTKKYLSEKIPKERREQTVWRLKKMIIEIQGHADCKSRFSIDGDYY
jgi:hypothetical protein